MWLLLAGCLSLRVSALGILRALAYNHKSRLNAHRRRTAENRTKDDYINRQFNQPDHQGLSDVRVRLIDKCFNEARLRDREAQWA